MSNPGGREWDDPAFQAESLSLLRTRVRLAFLYGTPIYLIFWLLDWFVAAGLQWTFLALRAGSLFFILPCAAFAIWGRNRRLARVTSVASMLGCTLTIAIMTFLGGGFGHIYYVFLTIPMYVVAVLYPWDELEVTAFLGITVGVYAAGNLGLMWKGFGRWEDAVQALFFVLVGAVYTYVTVLASGRARLADFKLRMDLEHANNELRELDKLKTGFFANVSHELRTPLTLILSPLESVLADSAAAGAGPPPRRALETIHANALRLLKLINTLLDFARLDEGRVQLNVDHHDLGDEMRRIVETAMPFAERRGVRLTCHAPADLPRVWADLDMMEKVIYNLLSNALKFTPQGGEVSLVARADAERLWIVCRDTGPGIAPDAIERIFERFQHTSTNSRASGSGIGLSLARELARLHKGDVEVKSELGCGAEFRLWLPLKSPLEGQAIDRRQGDRREGERRAPDKAASGEIAAADAPAPPAAERRGADRRAGADRRDAGRYEVPRLLFEASEYGAAPTGAPRGRPRTGADGVVLIADDHREMREYARMLLEDRYFVLEAADGRTALEIARRERPDVVVADYMMPELDGFGLVEGLRAAEETALVPVIVVTARAELSARLSGLKIGANDFLVKPFHPEELKAKVGAFVRLRRFETALAERTASLERSLAELAERETRLAAIGRMTSTIVHDLRNPLTAVVGFSQLALATAEETKMDSIAEDLRPVVKEGQRLRRMFEELLAFARGGAAQLTIVQARAAEVLSDAIAPLAEGLAARRIELALDIAPLEGVTVQIDRDVIMRVFENLVRNSAEAIDARAGPAAARAEGVRGNVRVSGRVEEDQVVIRVQDDGCGIPKQARDQLFQPFVTSGKPHGTGLGLATARNLVRALGGEVAAEADPPDGGACFRLTLPIASEKAFAETAGA
jgi:signal transduction histidine kinase